MSTAVEIPIKIYWVCPIDGIQKNFAIIEVITEDKTFQLSVHG